MNLTIKPLTPELIDDYLWFFDNRAFCDNPDWALCYCMFYNCMVSLHAWMKRTLPQNRAEAEQQINAGKLKGFLAYYNNKPVGFCNVNEKSILHFNKYRTEINSTGTDGIVSVVCFVIDPDYRRKGISRLLLSEVIQFYKNTKHTIMEAYPSRNTEKETDNYHGFNSLYQSEGFYEEKSYKDYYIMRLALTQ